MSIFGLVGLSYVIYDELPWVGKMIYIYLLLSLIPLTFMIVAMAVGLCYVCLNASITTIKQSLRREEENREQSVSSW